MGACWLLFLIEHLYLIGVCLNKDQRTNTLETYFVKNFGLRLRSLFDYSTLNNVHNWEDICIHFLSMFHH